VKAQDNGEHPFWSTWKTRGRPIVLGHRGGSKKFQENTIAAIRDAHKRGLDGVEVDVMLTKDKRVVLFHDEDIERLCGIKNQSIIDMTWEEISKLRIMKKIDVTGNGNFVEFESEQPISLLDEVLNEFKGTGLLFDLELKIVKKPSWKLRHTGRETAKIVRQTGTINQIVATSFDFFMLASLEKEFGGIHSGFAYDDDMALKSLGYSNTWYERFPDLDHKDKIQPHNNKSFLHWIFESNVIGKIIDSTCVCVEHTLLDDDTVEKFHKKGMAVGVYTIFPEDMRHVHVESPLTEEQSVNLLAKLFEKKVEWIESDDADKATKIMEALKQKKNAQEIMKILKS